MLLETYLALTGVGAGLWLLGHYFSFTGLVAIGGVLVLAVGGTVVATGLAVQSGEYIERSYEPVNETAASNGTAVNVTDQVAVNETHIAQTRENALHREFGDAGPLSLGGLQMLAGALLISQHLARRTF